VSTSYENLKKKSKGDDMWEVRNKAIGSTSSEKTIDVKKDTKFSSLLRVEKYTKGEFGDRVKNKDREVVPVERLENEIKTNKDSKIFLKVDVQGFEKEVWNGVGKLWKKVEIVQTEISTKRMYEDEEEWGYEVRELSERGFGMLGLFPVHRDSKTGEVVQYDCLMSKS
jgi:FkbM family methyltransferase